MNQIKPYGIERFTNGDAYVEVEMKTLYIREPFCVVKVDGETLRVHFPSESGRKEKGRVVRVPLELIEQVMIIGDSTLTTPALHALMERKVMVHYLSAYGRSCGVAMGDFSRNAGLRLAQYGVYSDYTRRFAVARQCIRGKLMNMRTLLMRFARSKDRDESDADTLSAAAGEIQTRLQQLEQAQPLAVVEPTDRMHGLGVLFGVEGAGSKAYYAVFGRLLKYGWQFHGRVRRPPTDPVNALLSFGYAILTNQVVTQIAAVGLDMGVGMLHQVGSGKPALALDLVEEFRPIIVDSVVISLLNNRQLTSDDFECEMAGAWRLTDDARKVFLVALEERLETKITHPVFDYQTSYRRCIGLQVRLFAKYAQGEIADYVPFIVR